MNGLMRVGIVAASLVFLGCGVEAPTPGNIKKEIKTEIVAPDMTQKIVAPDMVQKIVAPDMVQK